MTGNIIHWQLLVRCNSESTEPMACGAVYHRRFACMGCAGAVGCQTTFFRLGRLPSSRKSLLTQRYQHWQQVHLGDQGSHGPAELQSPAPWLWGAGRGTHNQQIAGNIMGNIMKRMISQGHDITIFIYIMAKETMKSTLDVTT